MECMCVQRSNMTKGEMSVATRDALAKIHGIQCHFLNHLLSSYLMLVSSSLVCCLVRGVCSSCNLSNPSCITIHHCNDTYHCNDACHSTIRRLTQSVVTSIQSRQ